MRYPRKMSTATNPTITATAEKKGRGSNPNSLANLRPFKKGVSGNPTGAHPSGPMVTPALRRYAGMTIEELVRIDMNKLTAAEAIAITYLIDSMNTSTFTTGAKSRDSVTERLDGPSAKADITVNVGVAVSLAWSDGSPA